MRQLGGPASLAKGKIARVTKVQRLIWHGLAIFASLAADVVFVELDWRLEGHAMRHCGGLAGVSRALRCRFRARVSGGFAVDKGRYDG